MTKNENQFIERLLKDYLELETPEEETIIWRYLDFPKFMSLLQKRKLFFPKGDDLPDPFEGITTEANISRRRKDYPHIPPDVYENTMRHMDIIKKYIYVNCWNISKNESNLMWASYVKDNFGVAIQSTSERLNKCFPTDSNLKIRTSRIKYINYNIDKFNELVGYLYFLRKRQIYKYENELRVLTIIMEHKKDKIPELDFITSGVYIPINLDTLVEKIVLSPKAKSWHKDLIKAIIEKYSLRKKVIHSKVDEIPTY